MKFLCPVLILGLSLMAYAQSPAPQLSAELSQATAQSNAQSQTPHPTNAPPPAPQPSAEPSPATAEHNAQSQTPHPTNAPPPAPQPKRPAKFYRWELSGGYAHISGNQGLNGFNAGASFFLNPSISLGFNFDGVWDTTILGSGVFAFTNIGLVTSKSHLYDYMSGPRIYFPGVFKPHCGVNALPVLRPFVQAQFGESTLFTQVTSVNVGTVAAQDTAFSWLLGGGGDFRIDDHFAARVSADLLRTHIADSGQSRIRVILGVVGRF